METPLIQPDFVHEGPHHRFFDGGKLFLQDTTLSSRWGLNLDCTGVNYLAQKKVD